MDSTFSHESVVNVKDLAKREKEVELSKKADSDLLERLAMVAFVAVAALYLATAIYALIF
jgi:hypothetical protein